MSYLVDELVTYEQVARHLPRDIRRAIEDRMPCIGGGEHHWDAQDENYMRRTGAGSSSNYPRRECLRCHVTRVNPDYLPRA